MKIGNSWGGGGEHLREMYEMYKIKLVSQSVSQSVSQLGQSVKSQYASQSCNYYG